jgi:hypothetical protein
MTSADADAVAVSSHCFLRIDHDPRTPFPTAQAPPTDDLRA